MASPKREASPAAGTVFRPADDLKNYPRNARIHSPRQISQICAAIVEWGWTDEILVDDLGMVIAGHGRLAAAKKLYAAGQTIKMMDGTPIPAGMVPVKVARGWSAAQVRAYVLGSNQIAANAGWDETLLNFELAALSDMGFDLDLTGFANFDLDVPTEDGAVIEDSEKAEPDQAKFWVTLRGPLEDQARVLDAVKEALGEPGAVSIDIGSSAGA